ncbi:MAG: OmpA family protein [Bacteroidota bacterium]
MKAQLLLPLFLLSFLLLTDQLFAHAGKLSNNELNVLTTGYYVVIGAYSANKENYAEKYMSVVKNMGYNANYGFSRKKNLYFVYLNTTGNYRESLDEMREARKAAGFADAWVFVCLDAGAQQTRSTGKEVEPEENDSIVEVDQENVPEVEPMKALEVPVVETQSHVEKEVRIEKILSKNEFTFEVNSLADATVFFNLHNAQNKKDIIGDVQIVDGERAKLINVVESGNYISLADPKNGTGKLMLIADVFGYRRAQFELNYYDPADDLAKSNVELLADVLLVNLDLVRYHVGDIVTMYNVYFFKDAALMRPESKYEIKSLLDMLQENEDYRIKIHGHVNGKHPGKIISKGESKNFFALDESNSERFGSAKELSLKRAELIRQYLIENGIDANRMEIKAWGGKRMIHDKHSSKAKENVRVEIEILED